ncbi:hypothetical protein KVR01_006869 [Diaporthe batatas]|uniref:uncharacterized protein n=1 Tax=Diaporthe batatas TaxID=748121 RepID=UPI001D0405AB|nr:uncharacterized protein KVR01_006869 [Diaporthe batatas]KAG8163572.1 hypothetical protein KVR01_006869 [Diaporthe batatas]
MAFTYNPLVEMWTLYVVGSMLIFIRVATRWRMVGLQGFKPDDYLVWFSWIVYTVMSIAAHICGVHADLHTLSLEQRRVMTEEEAAPYIWVTQWFCAGVATYIVFIWSLKFNMLFFYQRVVDGLAVDKFIKPGFVFVGCTFISIICILFASCRPYHRMWMMYPDQGANCEPQAEIYMLPALIMNIFTDLCIMAIPAPAILTVRTTIQRKISLIIIFSAGIFVMIAAILRVSMVLVGGDGGTAAIWSCREDFVAICVGQAPILRPLLTKRFWTGEMSHNSKNKSTIPIQSNDAFEMSAARKGTINGSRSKKGNSVNIFSTQGRDSDEESTDRIINNGGIMVNTWVGVETETPVSRQGESIHHSLSYRDGQKS